MPCKNKNNYKKVKIFYKILSRAMTPLAVLLSLWPSYGTA